MFLARAGLALAVFVAGIGLLGIWTAGPAARGIEADLTQRARTALSTATAAEQSYGPAAAQVRLAGRDVTLSGDFTSVAQQRAVQGALMALPGLRALTDRSRVLPLVEPYTIALSRTALGTVWRGHVPSEALRAEFARTTSPDGAAALDLAAGMPDDDWPGFVAQAQTALAHLAEGQFVLSDRDLRLSGRATDAASASAAEAALAILPAGYSARTDISRPQAAAPALLGLRLDKSASGALTASGALPRDLSQAGLPPGVHYLDAATDGADWAQIVTVALAALARVQPGQVQLAPDLLRLTGTLRDGAGEQAIWAAMADLPEGVIPVLDLRRPVDDAQPGPRPADPSHGEQQADAVSSSSGKDAP